MPSPKAVLRKPCLLMKMQNWFKKNAPDLDDYTRKHELYNLFLTSLDLRPAFLSSGRFDMKKFASDFNLAVKTGPYFDDDQAKVTYFINRKHSRRFEPLFKELRETYKDKKVANFRRRQKLIGVILGFDKCPIDYKSTHSYGIDYWVASKDKPEERTDVFALSCSSKHINQAVVSAVQLITKATPYFDPYNLILGFEVSLSQN